LVDLEKNKDAVEGAWLNKKGTIVAVKWNTATNENTKAEIIKTISTDHSIELTTLASTEAGNYASPFPITASGSRGKKWMN
jgi:hypothetical protein